MDNHNDVQLRVTHIEAVMPTLATKVDIAEIKTALAEISVKMDISAIRQTVEKSHTDIYKWAATLTIGLVGIGFAVYAGLKQSQPLINSAAQQQPPIIISIPQTPSPQLPARK